MGRGGCYRKGGELNKQGGKVQIIELMIKAVSDSTKS